MVRKVDLHTHSTASDGQYAPAALAAKAAAAGIECLALTDHDTVDGLAEALAAGAGLGLAILPGVELGALEDRHLHLLGYGFDPGDAALTGLCRKLRNGRDERKYRIIAFLREKGIDLSLAEVEALAGGDVIARPHFAQVMLRRGFVTSTREAFDKYLDTDEYQRIERFKADAETCIAAIRGAGGHVSLAHPYQLGWADDALEALVARLKALGLEGLECYYPKHSPAQVGFFLELGRKYGLHPTGGSDFHGEAVKPEISISPVELDVEWLFS